MGETEHTQRSNNVDRRWFSSTHWSVVGRAIDGSAPGGEEALEKLCRTYWYPLYAYVRRRGYGPEEAQDLTQGFFAHLLEKRILQVVDAQKGKFRSFLLASVNNFLANEWDRSHTVKRGGKQSILSWDDQSSENRYLREPSHELTPERIFEQSWALTVIETVLEQLRKEYASAGKQALFTAVQTYLSGDNPAQTYSGVAASLDMSEGAVKMSVLRLRNHFRELLRTEIAHTVAGPLEVEDELRHLFACLGGE